MKHEVTCLKCKRVADVVIGDNTITFGGGIATNLLAGRFRKDGEIGWECSCGNDNRVSKQEKDSLDQLVKGTPQQIADIVNSLSIPDNKQFTVRTI